MRSRTKKIIVVFGIAAVALSAGYFLAITPYHSFAAPESAQGLLYKADTLSWNNQWPEAKPFYERAAAEFAQQNQPSKALYATVSAIPADETVSASTYVLLLTNDLRRPEAQEPETRLRILTILGIIETNYNAALALPTWKKVQQLAFKQGHVMLASRAQGEQGIAAYILGDKATGARLTIRAWTLAKAEQDSAATIRYASLYGAGLVEMERYKQALTPLNEALRLAQQTPTVAYPTIAVDAKIEALGGLHQYKEALELANAALQRLQGTLNDGEKTAVYLDRALIERGQGNISAAAADCETALAISKRITFYRGVVNSAGVLALIYEQANRLPEALTAINAGIEANTHIPYELYLVPRNLATKANIESRMGMRSEADGDYRRAIALVNRMIRHAPNPGAQRQLLTDMSNVYSGYFASLCSQRRYDEALQILDNVRGRLEAESLQHHEYQQPHEQTPEEKEVTRLNVSLINTDDPATRIKISSAIYTAELSLAPDNLAAKTITHPVHLVDLQHRLGPGTLLIEYVLAEPGSYAFAITHESVKAYRLPAKSVLDADATQYREEIRSRREDKSLGQKLFSELLLPIPEYSRKTALVIVPDGALHLLPFSALVDSSSYVLASHTVDVNPSSTVYSLLSRRVENEQAVTMPYIGVAAWTQPTDTRNPFVRAVTGPQRSKLVALPDSKLEVESIAQDLPKPSTILEGASATEGHFKSLPLDSTDVIHLALHGYADLDYPERSALIFAPDPSGSEDGLLQLREIRDLHLKAKLVTLSACDTGVGPVGEAGVDNLVNAFIEAGADSVVSTLWELDDSTTEHLMIDFYGLLAGHKQKVDALRAAQLNLMHDGLLPYFWASFQIVGDPNGTLRKATP
jgi:CHAT domain-containing protein